MTLTESVSPDVVAVAPARRLRGRLRMPGDKSITHRALLLAAAAAGRSEIRGASDALDCRSTASCLRALGVTVETMGGPDESGWRVDSNGVQGWRAPDEPLDCGNSGTTLRLLSGLLAAGPTRAVLDGDVSLRRRPVGRIIEPLRRMGATISASAGDSLPPVTVVGRQPLVAVTHAPAAPSAQVKSALLLAGLGAAGRTVVRETVRTRDHTERMLRARGVEVDSTDDGEGAVVSVTGPAAVRPLDERVPGDLSAAAFWLVAGSVHPDAELVLEGIGVNPTRRAVLDLLRAMGASIDEEPRPMHGAEPVADLQVRSSELRPVELSAADSARAIDELPILCLAAAFAGGRSRLAGLAELRRKESDRLTGIANGLRALGCTVQAAGDDLVIDGRRTHGGALRGGRVDALDDHRLAMTFAMAGLLGGAETVIEGAASVAVSYPSFFRDLQDVRA